MIREDTRKNFHGEEKGRLSGYASLLSLCTYTTSGRVVIHSYEQLVVALSQAAFSLYFLTVHPISAGIPQRPCNGLIGTSNCIFPKHAEKYVKIVTL